MSDKILTVEKRLLISEEMNNRIEGEMERNPRDYKNEQNQRSEGELVRKALDYYLIRREAQGARDEPSI